MLENKMVSMATRQVGNEKERLVKPHMCSNPRNFYGKCCSRMRKILAWMVSFSLLLVFLELEESFTAGAHMGKGKNCP